MNKYQEALDNILKDNPKIQLTTSDIHKDIGLLLKLVNKEKPMRTEEQVLKDFKKLGYDIIENDNIRIKLKFNDYIIRISKYSRSYKSYWEGDNLASRIDFQEHKLIHELFEIYGWL